MSDRRDRRVNTDRPKWRPPREGARAPTNWPRTCDADGCDAEVTIVTAHIARASTEGGRHRLAFYCKAHCPDCLLFEEAF